MSEGGAALMAIGIGEGEDRARKAAEKAINNELLDIAINGARGILFNITGGEDMTLFEVNEAAAIIRESADKDVNLIFGAVIDPSLDDRIRITVVATGYPDADSYVGGQPVLAQQPTAAAPIRPNSASQVQNKNQTNSGDLPDFINNRRNKEHLDIPPFLKMKPRE